MEQKKYPLKLTADQKKTIADSLLVSAVPEDTRKIFTIALKKGDYYEVQITPEELDDIINSLCGTANHTKDRKLRKKLDKLSDYLEDRYDEMCLQSGDINPFQAMQMLADVAVESAGRKNNGKKNKADDAAAEFLNDVFGYILGLENETDKDDFEDEDFKNISENTGAVCTLKVFLAGTKDIWRKIAIRQGQTLHDLHNIIFDAFDRYDEHLYSFFIPSGKIKKNNPFSIYKNSTEYTHPHNCDGCDNSAKITAFFYKQNKKFNAAETSIGKLSLVPGMQFFYLFDFGDEWRHEITVESIDVKPDRKQYPRIIESKGKSPDQYKDD